MAALPSGGKCGDSNCAKDMTHHTAPVTAAINQVPYLMQTLPICQEGKLSKVYTILLHRRKVRCSFWSLLLFFFFMCECVRIAAFLLNSGASV